MARLLIKMEGLEQQTLELRPGVNRVGRDPDSDFPIDHPTVSANHCELVCSADGLMLRDCNSSNGTFVNGEPIREAWLRPGQTVVLGGVELFVEDTGGSVVIPRFERERPKPPVILPDGAVACPRHPQTHATYKCTHCGEVMCAGCVHVMRLQGGQPLLLCLLCSHKCEPIETPKIAKKKSFLGFLRDTAKIRFRAIAGREKSQK